MSELLIVNHNFHGHISGCFESSEPYPREMSLYITLYQMAPYMILSYPPYAVILLPYSVGEGCLEF